MSAAFAQMLDKSYEGKPLAEILAASPAELAGVTAGDAELLEQALGIESIRDMAENRFFRHARALLAAAGELSHDPGPGADWQRIFAKAPLDFYRNHPARRFRIEFGPVYYRGRLDGTARVLIVGQDPSTDELLVHRAFIGHSGQRLQGLLRKIGLSRSYIMVNTFLYGVYGQFDSELRGISLQDPLLSYRNQVLDELAGRNQLAAVVTIGAGARHAVESWPGGERYQVFELVHPSAPEEMVIPNWNQNLPLMQMGIPADGVSSLIRLCTERRSALMTTRTYPAMTCPSVLLTGTVPVVVPAALVTVPRSSSGKHPERAAAGSCWLPHPELPPPRLPADPVGLIRFLTVMAPAGRQPTTRFRRAIFPRISPSSTCEASRFYTFLLQNLRSQESG
jgi:hypothetical protein